MTEKKFLKFIGRDYMPLEYGKEYEFVRAEDGMYYPDIYITVLAGGATERKVTAYHWRFDITREEAEKLKT